MDYDPPVWEALANAPLKIILRSQLSQCDPKDHTVARVRRGGFD